MGFLANLNGAGINLLPSRYLNLPQYLHWISADCRADLQKLHDIQPPFADLILRHERLRTPQPLSNRNLRQASP